LFLKLKHKKGRSLQAADLFRMNPTNVYYTTNVMFFLKGRLRSPVIHRIPYSNLAFAV